MSEEEVGEDTEKEDELSLTLAEAVRAPEKGELEQLISSELALAIMSRNPLQKIRHVLEAYRLLPPETYEQLFTEGERDEFNRLYEVCISFMNTVEATLRPEGDRVGVVAWSFPIGEAGDYLGWVRRVWADAKTLKRMKKASEEEKKQERQRYLRWLYRLLGGDKGDCPLSLIRQVQSEFTVYCMPRISKIMRVIFTNIITRETWSETLLFMRGRGKQTP